MAEKRYGRYVNGKRNPENVDYYKHEVDTMLKNLPNVDGMVARFPAKKGLPELVIEFRPL